MEQFVKLLYDRLEDRKELQTELLCIMDNAINEMHNNQILSRLPEDVQAKLHGLPPEDRVTEKASLAKSVGKSYIPSTGPVQLKDGSIGFSIQVNYDPRFENSICLCIQGGVEGLYQSGLYQRAPEQVMNYYIQTNLSGAEFAAFRQKILKIDAMYENFQLIVIPARMPEQQAGQTQGAPTAKTEKSAEAKKKGFFSALLKRKS